MRTFSVYALILGLSLCGLVMSNHAFATVLSGHIEGTCRIVAVDECKLSFFSDIRHDERTPIIAARVRANGVIVSEYRNDAINPSSIIPGRTVGNDNVIAAQCGQRYILRLYAQATDDTTLKSLASTREIPTCSIKPCRHKVARKQAGRRLVWESSGSV
jgi:hypothetical protein